MKSNYFQKLVALNKSRKIFKNWNICAKLYLNQIKDRFAILETRTNKKIKVRTDTTDFMALANIWLLEDYKIKKFEINSDDVIIDIGAHIGIFTIYASQFCNNGKIFCFEPIQENYKMLIENININQIKNIYPNNLAVTKDTSTAKIFLNDDKSGHSMFIENKSFVQVDSKSLFDVFADNRIEECNFLKLDCEGAEYEIIESLPSDFFSKIDKTVIEYHMADTKPELLEGLIKKLKQLSFTIHTRPLFSDIGFLFARK